MFIKYLHLEKWDTEEVLGIEENTGDPIYIFPKLDGTNGSFWYDSNSDLVRFGSRRREIFIENDNRDMVNILSSEANFKNIYYTIKYFPQYIFYGEWLCKHTIKTYKENAWGKFYIFDVYNRETGEFIPYEEYLDLVSPMTKNCPNIEIIPPLAIAKKINQSDLKKAADTNYYLMQEGEIGEGVVVKKYQYKNRYGRTVWAKYVRTEFTAKHIKEMGPRVINSKDCLEEKIINKYVTEHLVFKTIEKLRDKYEFRTENFPSKLIPELIQTVYYDIIREEAWSILKEFKNPTINFKLLNKLCNNRTKIIAKI